MKTVPLLVCICALSACFTLSEGQSQQWRIYHRRNNYRGFILDRRPPFFYPEFRRDRTQLIQRHVLLHRYRHQNPSYLKRRKFTFPKYPWAPKCADKNDTSVNNNTPEATTQTPLTSPTSASTKIASSPGVTPRVQNVATISTRESDITTDSSAATPAPQPSSVPPETTASPNTTPKFSATTLEPETSKTTAASTAQATVPVTTQITTLEQTTSSSIQNAIIQFLEYITRIAQQVSAIISSI